MYIRKEGIGSQAAAIGPAPVSAPGRPLPATGREGSELDSAQQMDRFLADVERRALRMAQIATGDADEALDIVQDAMLKLAQKYAGRDAQEWGPLFYRILQSRIRDWHRRRLVRNRYRTWFRRDGEAQDGPDPVGALADPAQMTPDRALGNEQAVTALEAALRNLPLRQQQVFLLRAWEGLPVSATAAAMGCGEGSVKTHYSRAVHALRAKLGEHWS